MNNWHTPHRQPENLSEHTEDCTEPRFIWQAQLTTKLTRRRGYCPSCGAVAIAASRPGRNTP